MLDGSCTNSLVPLIVLDNPLNVWYHMHMKYFKCTLHNCDFQVDDNVDQQKYPTQCPVCSWEKYWKMKAEMEILRQQNAALLAVIEIKMDKLVTEVHP